MMADRNNTDAYSGGPGHALNILGNFLIKSHSRLKMIMMSFYRWGNRGSERGVTCSRAHKRRESLDLESRWSVASPLS